MNHLVLVAGYIGMGKDYLFDMMVEGKLDSTYSIWSRDQSTEVGVLASSQPFNRCKFALQLKRDVIEYLGITINQLDQLKDTPLRPQHCNYQWCHISPPINPLYRHILIDRGNYMRSIDPDYWLKAMIGDLRSDHINVITDWRFLNEVNLGHYIDGAKSITTVRVHRANIPIPPLTLGSEHELDDYRTDLLVLNRDDHPMNHVGVFSWMTEYCYRLV